MIFILIKLKDEIIIKKNIETDVDSILFEIKNKFPNSKFFLIDFINQSVYQTIKGITKEKNLDTGLYFINEKYRELLNDEIYELAESYDSDPLKYDELIEDLKSTISKPLVIDKWKFILGLDTLYDLIEIDPTTNQKYLDWLCNFRNNFYINNEDYDKIRNLLKDFDKPQVKSLIKKAGYSLELRDYQNDKELFKIIDEVYYSKLDDVESSNREILYQKRKVFEDKNWLVVSPSSYEESVTLGRRTNWCTAADSEEGLNNYNFYTENNKYPLYIFINKDNENEKYQWSSNPKNQDFLDKNDDIFKTDEIFEINFLEDFIEETKLIPKKFRNYLGKNHKETYPEFYYQSLNKHKKIDLIENLNEYVIECLLKDYKNQEADIIIELLKLGYLSEEFLNDSDYKFRAAIAMSGKYLDILIHDEDSYVKAVLAKQGYGLNILVNDENYFVKKLVLEFCYGLDILINDRSTYIVIKVKEILQKIKSGELKPYINKYGFECYK